MPIWDTGTNPLAKQWSLLSQSVQLDGFAAAMAFLFLAPSISLGFAWQTGAIAHLAFADIPAPEAYQLPVLNGRAWAVLFPLFVVATAARRRFDLLPALAGILALWIPSVPEVYREWVFHAATLLTLLALLWGGHFASTFLALATILFIAENALAWIGLYPPLLSWAHEGLPASPMTALPALGFVLLVRMVIKAIKDNTDLPGEVPAGQRLALLKQTVALWYPALIIFTALAIGNHLFQAWYVAPRLVERNDLQRLALVNLSGQRDIFSLPGGELEALIAAEMERLKLSGIPEPERSANVEDSFLRLVDGHAAMLRARTDKITQDVKDAGVAGLNNSAAYVEGQLPHRFPGTETERNCGFNVGCYIRNGVKSMINSGYVSAKRSLVNQIHQKVREIESATEDKRQEIAGQIYSAIDGLTDRSKTAIRLTADGTSLAGALSLVYALMMLVKSFLVVFARVFYNKNPFAAEATKGRISGGTIAARQSERQLRKTGPRRLFIHRRFFASNMMDRPRVPQPFSLAITRILAGRYVLNLIDFSDTAHPNPSCTVRVDRPGKIVTWQLAKNTEVFLDIRNLVGFSETCTLSRKISLSVASLVFGRLIYHSIKGPGRIYLRTAGNAVVGNTESAQSIRSPLSLVAWNVNTQFKVMSALTKTDVFLGGFGVKKLNRVNQLVVFDESETRSGKSSGGIWRIVRTFALPF